MPGLRRSCRQHRSAGEDGCAQDSRLAAGARSRGDRVSELSERLRGIINGPAKTGHYQSDVVPRANPSDLENLLEGRWYGHCFIVERRLAPSAKYGRMIIGDLAGRL